MPNKIDEYCSNCMEEIISEPISVEVEINIPGYEGEVEMDVPVLRFFRFLKRKCTNYFIKKKNV